MAHVTRSPDAEQDIKDALVYSLEEWGAEQADKYALLIEEALEAIGENPQIGRPRFGVRLEGRS